MKTTIDLPEDLYHQLEAEATHRGIPTDALIAEHLQLSLERSSLIPPRPLPEGKSFLDVMQDCCGIGQEMPSDYATNPRYMEDLGK